ncbi:hypothetical protein QBC46DRAFT_442707 [Diplogelasinospora grovesii]|uniref:Uncharacterized protein n=1 Tax=Diplogelasinospora grovesii TaxID=303347 RepID=A0AAN6N5F3_9PEZI|nr:hypothetical protein QBC46DRAFT_442707 [Diplogelasinospora grovesii]
MTFWDSGPIIAICDLLFDIVRAFFLSCFPSVHPTPENFESLGLELNALTGEMREMRAAIKATTNVRVGPDPRQQESLAEIFLSVRNEMRANTSAIREQTEVIGHLRTDVQAIARREDVGQCFESMTAILAKMQDAFSKLPEPSSASPEALG